jgi:hypothetical protein
LIEAERDRDRDRRREVRNYIKRLPIISGSDRLFRNWLSAGMLASNDVYADVAGAAHQLMHHRAVQDFKPARPGRFADDNLRDVVGMREVDHVVGNATPGGRDGDRLGSKRFGKPQRIGDAIALLLAQL